MVKKIRLKSWGSKILFLGLFALIILACNKKTSSETSSSAESESSSLITMRLGTDRSGIDDNSFNAAAWRGILKFYGDSSDNMSKRGTYYDVVTADTQDQYEPNLRTMSEGGLDLVAVTGFTWADALEKISADYPEQKYLIVDINFLSNVNNNVSQITFSEHEGSFLVGLAAALKAQEAGLQNPKFGFIGGIPGSLITKFEVGYIQGIRTIIPDAEVLDYYANDWGNPALAKAKAEQWFAAGVYAIFSAAGSTGDGAIQAAKENRLAGGDVWSIGVDSDQYEVGSYGSDGESAILTSMVKKVETALEMTLNDIQNDRFSTVPQTLTLEDGGVGLPPENPNLSPEILAVIDDYTQQIVSGSLVVDQKLAEFQAPGHLGVGLDLTAVDD